MDDTDNDELIDRWRAGDVKALNDLLPLVYQELRLVAHRHMRNERANHLLQATGLIHEAYERLAGGHHAEIRNRSHFVAIASRLMRQVLIDHARSRLAAKRQGGIYLTLSEAANIADRSEMDVLTLDDALTRLSEFDQQQARIIELRFFGGLSIAETAEALGISEATVKREWTTARVWLLRELQTATP
jgi:RNA polymerase sigma factor (TIGR02999 family)